MKKSVMLLGDSIRLGYCARVKEILSDICDVYYPEQNCAWTKNTFWSFTIYMGKRHYDLIHWNNGIWDLHFVTPFEDHFCDIDEYVRDNKRLLDLAKVYGDKLMWATTIPGGKILDERKAINALQNTDPNFFERFLVCEQKRWNEDVRKYNEAAVKMYRENGAMIDDLYSVMNEHLEEYISEDGIHPNPDGYEALAQKVASEIRKALSE